MARDKGLIWVGGVDGEYRPVPKTCPKCGKPTTRRGNGDHRGVACVDEQQRIIDGQYVRVCDWRATVYSDRCKHLPAP